MARPSTGGRFRGEEKTGREGDLRQGIKWLGGAIARKNTLPLRTVDLAQANQKRKMGNVKRPEGQWGLPEEVTMACSLVGGKARKKWKPYPRQPGQPRTAIP